MTNSFNSRMVVSLPRLSAEEKIQKKALTWLSLTVFLLMAAPLLNVKIGLAPIYAIDFLAFMTLYYARQIKSAQKNRFQGFIVFILVSMLISEFVAGIRLNTLLQPIYIMVRTGLATSLFFSTSKIIQNKRDLEPIVKAGLLGAIITATLMIMSSLPQMQSIVSRYVFSSRYLIPSSDRIIEDFSRYQFSEVALRGRSLVGISIVSAAFLNTIWTLLFLFRSDQELGLKWRISMTFASILIPIAVVLSYSRGAITGLILVVIIVTLLNSSRVRRPVVIGVGLSILIFSLIGWDSEYFKFDWLQTKTLYQVESLYTNISMTERIYSYTEPFYHVVENPTFVFLGQGFARNKISSNYLLAGYNAASHSVFAAAYYGYGMLAAVAYIFLLLASFRFTWAYIWRLKNDFPALFSRAMLASLFGFSSWFLFGHAGVSEPRGAMLLFFVFGLVAVQSNFSNSHQPVLSDDQQTDFRPNAHHLVATQRNEKRDIE